MIHSQMVTPPLAAIDGTTFRLKTATIKSRTRSQRPRTRFKCGWLAEFFSRCTLSPLKNAGGRGARPTLIKLVRDHGRRTLLLRLRQRRSYIRESRDVLVDVGFGVLNGNRPLLVPPVRLC